MHADGEMEGVNSVVFLCRMLQVTADDSGALSETEGALAVLKCLITPTQILGDERRSRVYASMLERQATDHEVLAGMPPHPNIVALLHHYASSALLPRPFVPPGLLQYFAVTKTT